MKRSELIIGKRYIAMNGELETVEGQFLGHSEGIGHQFLTDFQTHTGLVHLDWTATEWHFTEVVPGEIEIL